MNIIVGAHGHANRAPTTTKHRVVHDLTLLQDSAGMSDRQLAQLAGYDRAALRRLRSGQRVNLQAIADLAEVFGYEMRLLPKGSK